MSAQSEDIIIVRPVPYYICFFGAVMWVAHDYFLLTLLKSNFMTTSPSFPASLLIFKMDFEKHNFNEDQHLFQVQNKTQIRNMSGAGRKHRAKHLTRQYLDVSGWVGPKEGETLAVCLESPHGQHVRVLLLFARPEDVPRLSQDATAGDAAAAPLHESDKPHNSSSGSASPLPAPGTEGDGEAPTSLEREQLAFLPGKFHKVIWLSIKDIVVVSDGTVTFKPSPEQVENFLKEPANAAWRARITAAQQWAEEQRVAVQRMPQYGATAQTTTSVLTGPQVHREADRDAEAGDEEGESGSEKMEDLVNPNWRNIKHHQQFFYGMDDDSDEGEEEEEEEDEEDRKAA